MSLASWVTLCIFIFIFVAVNLSYQGANAAASTCPKRTDYDARCKKGCSSDKDCKNKKKRVKKCLCDGPCGLSCIRVGSKCPKERILLTRLRRGSVSLNGKAFKDKSSYKFGDQVTYKCKKGFTLAGPSKLTCSAIGKWKPWDQGKPVCRKECKKPKAPKDGRSTGKSYEVGKVVRFRCNPGYQRQGPMAITCLPSLEWNARPPKCKVLVCKAPDIPENARISRGSQLSYQYGDEVLFSCIAGYFRSGVPTAVCDLNGWRSRGSRFPTCHPKSCGSPGYVMNGVLEGSLYTFESTVKFSCKYGYTMTRGNAYRRCLENQRWSGTLPTCERVDCGNPRDVSNGKIESYGTRYKDTQIIDCNLGYNRVGPREITCTGSGDWSHEPKCEAVQCDASYNSIDNGIAKGVQGGNTCNNTYNCRLDFECLPGYEFRPGQSTIAVCQYDGTWSSKKPVCRAKSCERPLIPQYGYLASDSDNFFYPSKVNYVCRDNYVRRGAESLRCGEDGNWIGELPSCIARCRDPGSPLNGRKEIEVRNGYAEDDSINFLCNPGYHMIGSKTITCERHKADWSNVIPQCRPKNCGKPDIPEYGSLEKDSSNFYFPSVVKFTCNDNYIRKGPESLRCGADGKWNGPSPTCIANCLDPGSPPNGRKEIEVRNRYAEGDTINFQCNRGYDMIGSKRITCERHKADWSHDIPHCRPKDCREPDIPKYGSLKEGSNNFYFPSIIEYVCNKNYVRIGSESRSCQDNGKWSGRAPSCRAYCDDPGTPSNGKRKGNYFYENGVLDFDCKTGYKISGAKSIKCRQDDASWSNDIPKCEVVKCEDPTHWVANGDVNVTGRTYQAVVTISCRSGYILDGADRLKCGADGKWDKKRPVCNARPCGAPPSLVNGRRKLEDKKFVFNTVIEYECNEGFMIKNYPYLKCGVSGNWSQLEASCVEISCPKPGVLGNGRVDLTNTLMRNDSTHKYSSEISYTCNRGFALNGENVSRCEESGWSGGPHQCKVIDCGRPDVPNSVLYDKVTTLNSETKISCKIGYQRIGADEVSVCQENSHWSNLPECRAVDCGKPEISNSLSYDQDTIFNTKAIINCLKGYKRIGTSEPSVCREDGTWSNLPECKVVDCGKPDVSNSVFNDQDTTFNAKANINCLKGYKRIGTSEPSVCREDGTWSNLPECKDVYCDGENALGMESGAIKDDQIKMTASLPNFKQKKGRLNGNHWCGFLRTYHGEVSVQIRFKSVMEVKKVMFQFPFAGDSKLLKHRVTKVMFRYFDAENSNKLFAYTEDYDVDLKSQSLYNVTLKRSIKCSYFEIIIKKSWEERQMAETVCSQFEIYGCEEKPTCGIPRDIANGEAIGMMYKAGDVALYSCDSGYKMENKEQLKCLPNGTWTGIAPKCVTDNKYKGCYTDQYHPRFLLGKYSMDESLSSCMKLCRENNLALAGLQYSNQCFCASSLGLSRERDDGECYIPCNKEISRKCGGPWRNSVYDSSS